MKPEDKPKFFLNKEIIAWLTDNIRVEKQVFSGSTYIIDLHVNNGKRATFQYPEAVFNVFIEDVQIASCPVEHTTFIEALHEYGRIKEALNQELFDILNKQYNLINELQQKVDKLEQITSQPNG